MACKWLTAFLSDLIYKPTRCKHNILRVESEVMGSDDSTFIFFFFESVKFVEPF